MNWGAVAWIAILAAIGVVQLVRAQWFDAAVFFAVAVLLAVDAARPEPVARRGLGFVSMRVAVPVLVAAGVAATLLPRHGLAMQLLVCAVGVFVLVAAWPQRAARGAAWSVGRRRLARTWAIIVIAGCIWELGEFIAAQLRPAEPAFALSDLMDPLLDSIAGQALFVAAWMLGGLFLVSRVRR